MLSIVAPITVADCRASTPWSMDSILCLRPEHSGSRERDALFVDPREAIFLRGVGKASVNDQIGLGMARPGLLTSDGVHG